MNDITLTGALVAGIVGLTGAVGVLWRYVVTQFNGVNKRLVDCETDRRDLWRQLAVAGFNHTQADIETDAK